MKGSSALLLALLPCLGACGKRHHGPPSPVMIRDITLPSTNVVEILSLSPLPSRPAQPTNQDADNPVAAQLGQELFFDTRFSANGEVSCATCHQPANEWTDGKALSVGLEQVKRNAPSLWNVAYQRWYFWDGRKDSLWSQALGPIEHPSEMGGSRFRAYRLIRDTPVYLKAYESVFGMLPALSGRTGVVDARPVPDNPQDAMHKAWVSFPALDRTAVDRVFSHIGKAIEAFQRQLISTDAPFDHFVAALRAGDAEGMGKLSDAVLRGMKIFTGKGQCTLCHGGPNFTDNEFHNIGLNRGGRSLDQGRFPAIEQVRKDPFNGKGIHSDNPSMEANKSLHYVAPKDNNLGEFKTPSLRNVTGTGPYMHDGRFHSLREVVVFYSTLPDTPAVGHREESLQPLHLDAREIDDLVAFLTSLTGRPLEADLLKPPEP
jgi:cytochrome c peroxidase